MPSRALRGLRRRHLRPPCAAGHAPAAPPAPLEVLGAEDPLVEFYLEGLPGPRRVDRAAPVQEGPVHARVEGRQHDGQLALAHAVQRALRPEGLAVLRGQVAPAVGGPGRGEAVDHRPPLVLRGPGQGPVQRRLREDEAVTGPEARLAHELRELLVGEVREVRGDGEVALVGPGHDTEAAVPWAGLRELHAHGEELVAHLPVPELVGEGPGGLAALGDGPAVQRVPLGALALRDHEGGVVQPVPGAQQLVEHRRDGGVRQHGAEGLAVRPRPAEHAAHVEAAGPAVPGQRPGVAPVQAGGPERPRALVQVRLDVGVDRLVRQLHLLGREGGGQDDVAVEVEEVLVLERQPLAAAAGQGHVVLVAQLRRQVARMPHPRPG
mmetsp:Transcript_15346/g.43881  ORF Transcript_15346/g.43881 Transcript_15346/m.43881 type:complete len:379 (-) Transcript_15346:131-1267(-)